LSPGSVVGSFDVPQLAPGLLRWLRQGCALICVIICWTVCPNVDAWAENEADMSCVRSPHTMAKLTIIITNFAFNLADAPNNPIFIRFIYLGIGCLSALLIVQVIVLWLTGISIVSTFLNRRSENVPCYAACASHDSSTSTISDISQSRLVTLAAIAGVTRSVL
jgi:hypothetical protein